MIVKEMRSPVQAEEEEKMQRDIAGLIKEKASLQAISYYNLGTQYEFLKNYKHCIENFEKAIEILEMRFEPSYPLALEFKSGLSVAISKYSRFLKWKGTKNQRTFSNLTKIKVGRSAVSQGRSSQPR